MPMVFINLMELTFTNMPILVLKDAEGRHAVPIWIGLIEASAIATELERIQLDRPMTHDLMHNLLGHVGARIERVAPFAAMCRSRDR